VYFQPHGKTLTLCGQNYLKICINFQIHDKALILLGPKKSQKIVKRLVVEGASISCEKFDAKPREVWFCDRLRYLLYFQKINEKTFD